MIGRLLPLLALLAACGSSPMRLPPEARPAGDAGRVAEAVVALPAWNVGEDGLAPSEPWVRGDERYQRYVDTARMLSGLSPSVVQAGYSAAQSWLTEQPPEARTQVLEGLFVLNRLQFDLPAHAREETDPSFVAWGTLHAPPDRATPMRWPVEVDTSGAVIAIRRPVFFRFARFDALGEFTHYLDRYPRRAPGAFE